MGLILQRKASLDEDRERDFRGLLMVCDVTTHLHRKDTV